MNFVIHIKAHYTANKASFTLSWCTLRCTPAVCSRRTRVNRNESWRNLSALIHSRQCYGPDLVVGKSDHSLSWLCYCLRRYIFGVAAEVLRCVPVRPNTTRLCPGHRRQSPGVTTTRHGSRMVKPQCYTVAYEYQWNSRGTYTRYVICKVQNLSYVPRQKRTAIKVVVKIGNGVINQNFTFLYRLSLIKKLLRINQITWLKIKQETPQYDENRFFNASTEYWYDRNKK